VYDDGVGNRSRYIKRGVHERVIMGKRSSEVVVGRLSHLRGKFSNLLLNGYLSNHSRIAKIKGSNPFSSGIYSFLGICSLFQLYPVNEFITGLVFVGQVKA